MIVSSVFAQEQKQLTMKFNNEPLQEVLNRLESVSNYKFLFSYDDISSVRVSGEVKDMDVQNVVKYVLRKTNLTYSVNGKLISIKKSDKTKKNPSSSEKGKTGYERYGGTVYFADTKEPVVGAVVKVEGTDVVAVTDMNGSFAFDHMIQQNSMVSISYIGTKTAKVKATENMRVFLTNDNKELGEVIVTGYQTIDKRKLTSAVTSVKAEDVIRPDVSSIDQMLEGRIPDMVFQSNSGEVGVVPRIRIRGTSTLIGNREPLWVLDGVVMQDPVDVSPEELNNPDYINRVGNAISGINPQDIERIDVLKDASATAIYGTKAANGVIVVTTKKGHVGKPIISYSGNVSLKMRPRYTDSSIDVMDSRERVDFSRYLIKNGYAFGNNMNLAGFEAAYYKYMTNQISFDEYQSLVNIAETTNTDWFKLLTSDAVSHSHTVSVSGGSDAIRYYTSISYSDDQDVIPNNSNQRYTAKVNLDAYLTSNLSVNMSINANTNKRNYVPNEIAPMDYAYNTSRAIPAYNADGTYNYYQRQPMTYSGTGNYYNYNILNEIDNSYNKQEGSAVQANLTLTWRPLKWLTAKAICSYQTSSTDQNTWFGEKSYHVADLRMTNYGINPESGAESKSVCPFGGELNNNHVRNNNWMTRLQLDANHYFGSDLQHNISGSLGFEATSTRYNGMSQLFRGYYENRGKQFSNTPLADYPGYSSWLEANAYPTITDNLTNLISAYATVSYSYKNYFTLNANARIDGSNKFGDQSNDKILPIWSVAGNYNLSEHEFLKRDWIDFVMLKASYGFQGNMLEGQTPQIIITQKPYDPVYGELTSELYKYPNPKLRWEKTRSWNAGLSFSVLNRRLQFEGDIYSKKTSDAFLAKNISTVNGVKQYIVNSGTITNWGYSLSVTAVPVQVRDFKWILSTSFSKVFNKMETIPGEETYELSDFLNGTALVEGQPVGTFYSYQFVGLNPANGYAMFNDWHDRMDQLVGMSKYDLYTSVLTPSGNREPTMSGNINNTFTYKNWRLNSVLAYSLGSKVRLFQAYKGYDPVSNINRELVNHWSKPGDEEITNIPNPMMTGYHWSNYADGVPAIGSTLQNMYNYSDIRVVSGNYLKFSTLSLTYEFPAAQLAHSGLSRLALTLTGNNLFTVCSSKLKGQTPQQSGFTQVQLTDRPSFTFGVNVSF